ncbi:MAG TPA: alpha/beta hydrolase [Gammaproteobacteria bacterium]|nr:alpha/beta hydrolase [Gammaproteobacteria bacterium]
MQHITTADGIETVKRITLGGIPQWISVRGRHEGNPILLFLHGGPGFTMMPASWAYMRPWEEYFTVVQWDQRGAGKTYVENDPTKIAPTMTMDRIVADAEELIRYLLATYDKDKIVLMGHSWGTILGVELAQKHPEWFYAYVGVSQGVNVQKNERMGYRALIEYYQRVGNAEAVEELMAIAPYPGASATEAREKLHVQRKWLLRAESEGLSADGYTWRLPDNHYYDVVRLSPVYTEQDIKAWSEGIEFSVEALWPEVVAVDFDDTISFKCPVILFHGRHDLTVSATLAAQWFKRLQAPSKKLIWFNDSAHMLLENEPGKAFLHLVEDVLPLTSAGATVPPR